MLLKICKLYEIGLLIGDKQTVFMSTVKAYGILKVKNALVSLSPTYRAHNL